MKILQSTAYVNDRMYCQSTHEVIFDAFYDTVNYSMHLNERARALIAWWDEEAFDAPEIKNEKLKAAWERYFEELDEWNDTEIVKSIEKFLKEYENDEWVVYEIEHKISYYSPNSTTVYYVVLADTEIQTSDETA